MAARPQQLLEYVRRLAAGPNLAPDRELLVRFTRLRDEDAFSELVRRHGSMVLGVCRRVLDDVHAAEDAFQATFLVLARKAAALRSPDTLASWLHGVARRLSLKCRRAETRRRWHETMGSKVVSMAAQQDPLDELTARELRLVLDEELQRLPEVYRLPLILCGLEGLTLEETARRVGWSSGSVKGRLVRGRRLLHARLGRRGLALPAGLLVLAAMSETVPPTLATSTADAARGFAAGTWEPGVRVSAQITALAQDALLGMRVAKLKLGLSLLLLIGTLAAGAGVITCSQPAAKQAEPSTAADTSEPARFNRVDEPLPSGERARLGTTRFRARRPINDARFSADGRRLVACAGGTLYIWKARDGSLLRTIDTKLEPLDDPTEPSEKKGLAFAVHPKASRVACGGAKDGKTHLQIWDFETGEAVAEKAGSCDALQILAWTADGKRLLERASVSWEKPTGRKLIVRDDKLAVVRTHDLPKDFGELWSTVMLPLPNGRQAILWQGRWEPTLFDLESGMAVRTIRHKPAIPSDLGISPDGTTLAATSTNEMCLFDLASGRKLCNLPILRGGWKKPRPLFAPDGKTVYVWDHQPIAYDVASGKEKWKATFRTTHNVRMHLCDISPDGTTLLMRLGHALSLVDAKTGTERNPATSPAIPSGVVWSPNGRTLFTRTVRQDRTWTAWEAATGKRLYDLQPTGLVKGDDWKMLPDLFFLKGGKEIAVCVEKSEPTERSGPKEFLIFDAATGQCQRRLGKPLPIEEFRWFHPIGVDGDGATVLMQNYTIGFSEAKPRYATLRWDPIRQVKLQQWTVEGDRMDPPRVHVPYDVLTKNTIPAVDRNDVKVDAARIRCYSLADGKVVHDLKTDFATVELDRLQGNFLLSIGFDSKWITRRNHHTYTPQAPYAYDLRELPSRDKLRVFELPTKDTVALGPDGRFVVHVLDARTFEIYDPFVLKKAVSKIATPSRSERFAFSPNGNLVAVSLADTTIVVLDAKPWRKQVDEQVARALPGDLTPLWDDLVKDAPTGLRAARLLSVAGDRAITLLAAKVTVHEVPDEAPIKQWITDLDSSVFATREKAEKNLRSLAGQAELHLRKQLEAKPSLEMRRRIKGLLEAIESRSLTAAEVREVRAVQALAWINTEAARTLLSKWAEGDPNATLTKVAKKASGYW